MGKHDVEGKQRGVREGEGDTDRLTFKLDVREHVDAGYSERERVSERTNAKRSEKNDGQELDRGDGAER